MLLTVVNLFVVWCCRVLFGVCRLSFVVAVVCYMLVVFSSPHIWLGVVG